MKKLIFAMLLIPATLCGQAADVQLKIYSGNRDTVVAEKQVIVAVTEPGATAKINGNDVKVYKTGSFGYELPLSMGDNKVTVEATKDGKIATKTFNIYRTTKKQEPQNRRQMRPMRETSFETPFFVETTGNAYLQYGNGDDRLGGSKIGFINDGIVMKVIGEKADLYKVALSKNRFAYLPKEYCKPTLKRAETVITGSWSVTNQGTSDRVVVSLPARLPYRYYTLLDPSTIVVELYGAMDNSNWITQRTMNLGMIDYVDFNQVESDVYQVIIHLKDKYQWGFKVSYGGSSLFIDVRHTPKSLALKDLKIGLDAGHGGEYLGAVSPSGVMEKDVNLDLVLRLKKLLEKAGAQVVLTREGDTGPSMAERKRIWREANVDLAISIHNNSGASALASPGTSTYYKHLFDRPLAQAILNRVLETGLPLFGLVGNFNFSLNGPTEFPNTLVEGMFMSSLIEEEKVADPEFRQLYAQKIFDGLCDYLREVEATVKPAKKKK